MSRKGLKNEKIIEAAIEMVEEYGYRKFSLRELAGKLNVQPSSLYNHVSGIEEINIAVGMHGIHLLEKALVDASMGKETEEALCDIANAYRNFANKNPELYHAVIELQTSGNELLKHELHKIIQPFIVVIEKHIRDKAAVVHLQRFFRSTLHGFVSLEKEGYLKYGEVNNDESFEFMVQGLINMVREREIVD
nr:TetR/AcrR family transcriptional regulator [Sedimentibacter sp.]